MIVTAMAAIMTELMTVTMAELMTVTMAETAPLTESVLQVTTFKAE